MGSELCTGPAYGQESKLKHTRKENGRMKNGLLWSGSVCLQMCIWGAGNTQDTQGAQLNSQKKSYSIQNKWIKSWGHDVCLWIKSWGYSVCLWIISWGHGVCLRVPASTWEAEVGQQA